MFSIRSLTRALPRNLIRSSAPLPKRTFTSLRISSAFQQPWRASSFPMRASFSTIAPRWQAQDGGISEQLSTKFAEELRIEKDEGDSSEMPEHLKEWLDNSPFQLNDTPGREDVVLTRSFGNEKVRIVFNIADLNTFDQDADSFSEDPALYDEQLAEDGAINQGGAGNPNFKVTPEDSASAADKAEAGEENLDDDLPGFPARVNITIEKEGIPSAIHIDATAKDGEIMIDNVYHFPKAEIVNAKTAEQEYKAKDLYTGPPFGNLDEGLQLLLDEYLAERGIDSGLAQFIPDYIDHKEQREYVNWLEEMKNFVEA